MLNCTGYDDEGLHLSIRISPTCTRLAASAGFLHKGHAEHLSRKGTEDWVLNGRLADQVVHEVVSLDREVLATTHILWGVAIDEAASLVKANSLVMMNAPNSCATLRPPNRLKGTLHRDSSTR